MLHAAVSVDEGRTWRGYREIARDPHRLEPSPPNGDHGVSYPFPTLTKDGKVVFSIWVETGRKRSVFSIDPAWLTETKQIDDFSTGLDKWSTFGTRGVEIVPHPKTPRVRVLSLRKPEADWPSAAVWNFPSGNRGRLRLRLMLRPGFKSANIGLTDHFSVPFDDEDRFNNLFNLSIDEGGRLAQAIKLETGRWYDLVLQWDSSRRECRVIVDGRQIAVVPQSHDGVGASYLRLRSTAPDTDEAGMLIEHVEAIL